MRTKKSYSLILDPELQRNIEEEIANFPSLPVVENDDSDRGLIASFFDSINICKAYCSCIVENNRSRELPKQIKQLAKMLDARNETERANTPIILENVSRRLNKYVEMKEMEIREIIKQQESENNLKIRKIQQNTEISKVQRQPLHKLIEGYKDYLENVDKEMQSIRQLDGNIRDLPSYKNAYQMLQNDYREKMSLVSKYIKEYSEGE